MPTIVSSTILMVIVCILARESDKRTIKFQTDYGEVYKEKLFVFLIIFSLSFYGAMRTKGNDTYAYISRFINSQNISLTSFFSSGWSQEKGPLFVLLRILCKKYIINNYHIFFLIVGLITNGLIVCFMRKYSRTLVFPLYLYICMSGYGTSLTGMRQEMATAVAIWTIPFAMEKKWLKFIVILWISFRIHFISILYIAVPFLLGKVWNSIAVVIVILTALAGIFFARFGEILLDFADLLGFENYNNSIIFGSSINIYRVLVYCVTPIWAYIKKEELSEKNPIVRCMGNISILAASFVFLGLFGKANTFGRFGVLFEPSNYITLLVVWDLLEDEKKKQILIKIIVVAFFIYNIFAHIKNGIWGDFYGMEFIF